MKTRNRFFALRHGFSQANEAGLIVSDMTNGCSRYGLTSPGKREVEASIKSYISEYVSRNIIIISSPFLRTKESARILSNIVQKKVNFDDRLRERFFGTYNLQHSSHYTKVWTLDKLDKNHKTNGVESVSEVYSRVKSLVEELEIRYSGFDIFLVSHGDSLQILECFFKDKEPTKHRELIPLRPGECRLLNPC